MQFKEIENPRGTMIQIDGHPFVFAPLSLGAVEKLLPALQGFQPNDVGTVIDVAHKSLKRNYPEISRDDVADLIYMDQLEEVMGAVMAVSGLKNKEAQEGGSGE
ncbi:hypothetical protein P7L54_20785 [Acinetobacter bereziniae]|uniref:Phage protein n=1 Tax=Acinetobacter bereziniae LMG 1003 = CIP 70.12 TaxID=981324 RepID=N9DKD8_ACIBZ|nr:hypothetical protein [Acinetobacter bereziniae]ENV98291.1 hypothetical protein F938_01145 [Acinetobacter bereziniae LMG 1003 = CIP 70.12]MBJ9908560.1 hypothetical protein [Acinetobacter bereziniae]MBJ9929869.1 hypothetical protein [Acinetobacter bereziniae]MDG3558378.1 hypothetical protein [Acinetobacter bereziniae]MDP6003535.1 hypothetical protein [Acinetobacter bereziniae]